VNKHQNQEEYTDDGNAGTHRKGHHRRFGFP
jgi:hypothetical protein